MDKAKRKAIIAGNWKMNKTAAEAAELVDELMPRRARTLAARSSSAPPTPTWSRLWTKTKGTNIHVGAENVHFEKSGAFTGEISADMLHGSGRGVRHRRPLRAPPVLRQRPTQTVNKRALAALNAGLKVILCVGESLEQREAGRHRGAGRACRPRSLCRASPPKQLTECRHRLRAGLGHRHRQDRYRGPGGGSLRLRSARSSASCMARRSAEATTVQYGGSMNAKNCEELLSQEGR